MKKHYAERILVLMLLILLVLFFRKEIICFVAEALTGYRLFGRRDLHGF